MSNKSAKILNIEGITNLEPNAPTVGTSYLYKINTDLAFYEKLLKNVNDTQIEILAYQKNTGIVTYPISIKYSKLIGKGLRIKKLVRNASFMENHQINSFYVYKGEELEDKIELVYALNSGDLQRTIDNLKNLIVFLKSDDGKFLDSQVKKYRKLNLTENEFNEKMRDVFEKISKNSELLEKISFSKSSLKNILVDCIYIDKIQLLDKSKMSGLDEENNFIRLSKVTTNIYETIDILKENGISVNTEGIISENDFIIDLDRLTYNEIVAKMPFMISAASNNEISFLDEELDQSSEDKNSIDDNLDKMHDDYLLNKSNIDSRPTIGVIDTYCKELEQFKDIIDINNYSDVRSKDYQHGTAVCTLVAANDYINNNDNFKDGLGIFKVKHFGILEGSGAAMPATKFIRKIERIIKENKHIKLWNLSIWDKNTGPRYSANISEVGKQFDRIQKENDVLFIVASGNGGHVGIGADSLYAITTGAIFKDINGVNKIASYTGETLKVNGLFEKPNLYDFGNDTEYWKDLDNNGFKLERMQQMSLHITDDSLTDEYCEEGSSFSTPRVSRKAAYLISEYGFDLNQVRAYFNLQASILKKRGIVSDISPIIEKQNAKYVITGKGKIKPGQRGTIKIKLPYSTGKNGNLYRDYVACLGLSYELNTNTSVGVEYCSTDLVMKLKADDYSEKQKKFIGKNMITVEGQEEHDRNTNYSLVKSLQKYNPNKVFIDKKIITKFDDLSNDIEISSLGPVHTKELRKVENDYDEVQTKLEIKCLDLFSDTDKQKYENYINYGFVIELFEIRRDSLREFEQENESIKLRDKIAMKSAS